MYVKKPLGFVNDKYPDHCYILCKAFYGLNEATHTWYAALTNFLKIAKVKQGSVDPTLFRMKVWDHLMLF